jgi:predicted aspartyl protease
LLGWNIILVKLMRQKEAGVRKRLMGVFFTAFFLTGAVLAQEEDIPIKGIVPFELKEHCIIVKAKVNGSSRTYDFLLDTGALTFIDKEVVEELDLKTRGNMAKMDTLEMGDVSIPNIFAFTTFNTQAFRKHGITFHGIIGSNLLERFKITLDYRNQRMIISPDDETTKGNALGYRCKFTNHPVNYAPLVNCTINGNVQMKAMVDTGQPYSIVLPLEYLDRLGARDSPYLIKSKGIMIKWPNTKTTDSSIWRLGQFEMENLKVDNLMCCFAELPRLLSVPLLGRDYLAQFLITIDYPNDEILFVPYREAQFVDNLFSFGINLARGEDNTIVVEGLWTGGPADRAGIQVGDEIVECNSMTVSSDDIFKLRQLLTNENLKDIKLIVKDKEGQHEVSLHKEMLLNGKNP